MAHRNRPNQVRPASLLGPIWMQSSRGTEQRILAKPSSVMKNPSHPLHALEAIKNRSNHPETVISSHRLIAPRCRTERSRKSFLLAAVRLFNVQRFLLRLL